MEQFLSYQVRINLIQQNIVNFKNNDTNALMTIVNDITVMCKEVMSLDDSFITRIHPTDT